MGPIPGIAFWPLLLLASFACWVTGKVILRPLTRRKIAEGGSRRYSLMDLISLVCMEAFGLAMVAVIVPHHDAAFYFGSQVFALVVIPLVWWVSVRMLSRAGVVSSQRHAVTLLLLIPLTWLVVVGVGYFLLLLIVKWLLYLQWSGHGMQMPDFTPDIGKAVACCLAAIPLCMLRDWVLQENEPP